MNISKTASFHILEDLEENSKYRVILTPVWKSKDIQDEIIGNVLTFTVDNTEEVSVSFQYQHVFTNMDFKTYFC